MPAGVLTPRKTSEPSRVGVRKGRPRRVSKTKNQIATTAAPIKPATIPSRRAERPAGFILAVSARILAPLPMLDVPRQAHAVVGVAQMRWQRGSVAHRAPGVGVTPGAAPAHAACPRGRSARIPRGGDGLVGLVGPVRAPI